VGFRRNAEESISRRFSIDFATYLTIANATRRIPGLGNFMPGLIEAGLSATIQQVEISDFNLIKNRIAVFIEIA
jgi:hypothetical protein